MATKRARCTGRGSRSATGWTARVFASVVPDTLLLLQRSVDRSSLIALADRAAHQRLITPARRAADGGAVRVDGQLWRLVDGRSESPSESRVRVVLNEAGCRRPTSKPGPRRDGPDHRAARPWVAAQSGRARGRQREHEKPATLYPDRDRQSDRLDPG